MLPRPAARRAGTADVGAPPVARSAPAGLRPTSRRLTPWTVAVLVPPGHRSRHGRHCHRPSATSPRWSRHSPHASALPVSPVPWQKPGNRHVGLPEQVVQSIDRQMDPFRPRPSRSVTTSVGTLMAQGRTGLPVALRAKRQVWKGKLLSEDGGPVPWQLHWGPGFRFATVAPAPSGRSYSSCSRSLVVVHRRNRTSDLAPRTPSVSDQSVSPTSPHADHRRPYLDGYCSCGGQR